MHLRSSSARALTAFSFRPLLAASAACATLLVLTAYSAPATRAADVATYQKLSLDDKFFAEGATFGDLNNDGHPDAIAGPYWWEGPAFTVRHEFYPASPYDPLRYSENFFTFTHDFNADGWLDILVLGFPGVDASWYENPGKKGGAWRRHVVFLPVDNESPTFAKLFPAAPPVLVCMSGGRLGYATWDPKAPTAPWTFHAATPPQNWQRFTHGLGLGDLNGDGRLDLLDKDGWWEQPAALAGDPVWTRHKFPFAPKGAAQMHVLDVNGDGLPDVITAKHAHGYGLSWFEQKRDAAGAITFVEHVILSEKPDEKIAGVQFAQLHAVALADFDGDGLPDILTGKRWWAHGPTGDADPAGAPVVYAFLLRRGPNGTATFEPRLLDATTGIGTQVFAADVNADGRPDIIVGNKRGTAVLLSQPTASGKK
ncbi:MAG: hypothetical protein RLZZ15_3362 [Verrucomicrobiota bacterium]|jgi:hypothetical protein